MSASNENIPSDDENQDQQLKEDELPDQEEGEVEYIDEEMM